MELMLHNCFSKLEIETHHQHSSSKEKAAVEEVNRNWVELPPNIMSLIFIKLGAVNILASAQWVCTSWWKLSKQPHLFRSIHVGNVFSVFGRLVYSPFKLSDDLAREAIDRSCGQLEEFSVEMIANDGLLQYMSEKSSSLRCLRLEYCEDYSVTDDGFIEIAKKISQLEELEIIDSQLSKDVLKLFGFTGNSGLALAIANNMPELRHLKLFGVNMTDNGLQAILDGCSHLESLDLRGSFFLCCREDLQKRCKSIKVLKLPNDPIKDSLLYALNDYTSSDGMNYDSEYCGSDDYLYAI